MQISISVNGRVYSPASPAPPPVETNPTASILGEINKYGKDGTLLFFQTRKKGVTRGRGPDKKVYGNDLVQVLLWTGFDYLQLLQRSAQKLAELQSRDSLITDLTNACVAAGHTEVTTTLAAHAIQNIQADLWVCMGSVRRMDRVRFDRAWEPLMVEGKRVPLCSVYQGPAESTRPVPGHIYVQGLKLGEKVLEKAPNGPWQAQMSPQNQARVMLLSWLPKGLYSQYILDPNREIPNLAVGSKASSLALDLGVSVNPNAAQQLIKIA